MSPSKTVAEAPAAYGALRTQLATWVHAMGWREPERISDEIWRLSVSHGGLLRTPAKELTRIKGIGKKRSAMLLHSAGLSRELLCYTAPRLRMREAANVWKHMAPRLLGLRKECFWVVLLNRRNDIIDVHHVSTGSLSATVVEPREVFRAAIIFDASAVILVHNHPSGDPTPSNQDQLLTERLGKAGRNIGIDVVDHVVITKESYCSFRERGLALC